MTAVLVAVVLGHLLWRCGAPRDGGAGPVTGTVLWAVAGTGGWMSLLALAGVAWRPWLLLLPVVVAGAVVAAGRRRRTRRWPLDAWALAAGAVAAPRALAVALTPAYGWDFRYLWGLKAKVFAAAGGVDTAWLAWAPLADLHPSYPPLWPVLLAAGPVLGGNVETTAAAWSALLVVGLAGVGWEAGGDLPRPLRAVAAVALAWTPVLFRPERSGYAEPLVAFLLCAALLALEAAARRRPGALASLAVAAPALALAKNEGLVLALACVAVAVAVGRRAALAAVAGTVAVAVGWRLVVAAAALPRPGAVRDAAVVAERAASLPAAVGAALTPGLVLLLLAWSLLLPALLARRPRTAAVVLAVWAAAVVAAYLTTPWGFAWHLNWSLDRVVALAFPGALAAALTSSFRPAAAPPAPDTSPAG